MPGRKSNQEKKTHTPSHYRALLRKLKEALREDVFRGNPEEFIKEARSLGEPYYRAQALFTLSAQLPLKPKAAIELAQEAFLEAGQEVRGWRKAELLTTLAKRLKSWRGQDTGELAGWNREKLARKLLDQILEMPVGKGLSEAILGVSTHLPGSCQEPLLERALKNPGFEQEDSKTVLRSWARSCDPEHVMKLLEEAQDLRGRAKLLGYLHFQRRKAGHKDRSPTPFAEALVAADQLPPDEEYLDTLRYLATMAKSKQEFMALYHKTPHFPGPVFKVRLLNTLAGRADKAGFGNLTRLWLKEAGELIRTHSEPRERVQLSLNLAQGLFRTGLREEAENLFREVELDLEKLDPETATASLWQRLGKAMKICGFLSTQGNVEPRKEVHGVKVASGLRHVLALFDAYEGGLGPVHYRALARAAPLCFAFDLDLALVGFPTDNLDKLVREARKETGVGKGGKYLKQLADQDRIRLIPATRRKAPERWAGPGIPVGTTSKPDPQKAMSFSELLVRARAGTPEPLILLMGLGKKGLPTVLLNAVSYHLELTGKNVPLETATVMGILTERLRGK